LQQLGVSSSIIDDVIALMMLNGIHGKLSGAGGDGGVILGFFIPKHEELSLDRFQEQAAEKGLSVLKEIEIDQEGLKFIQN